MSMKRNYYSKNSFKKHLDFIVIDFFAIELSYLLSVMWYHFSFGKALYFGNVYRQQSLILFVCLVASFTVGQPYKNILKRDKWQELSATIKHAVNMAIMDIFLMYIMKDATSTSRLTFAVTWIIYILLETSLRLSWKRLIRRRILSHESSRKQIIVLTTRDRVEYIKKYLDVYLLRDFDVCAVFLADFIENQDSGLTIHHAAISGNPDSMVDYAVHNWVDEVILDIPNNKELSENIEQKFYDMGITTHHTIAIVNSPDDDLFGNPTYVEKMGNYIVLTHRPREIAPIQITLKRILDIIGGIIGSFFAVIIMIIVGPIIKIKAPGPIIFSQVRVGKNGKTFKMYKIRSMYVDAEEKKAELMMKNKMNGLMFKMDDDPRIIGSEKKDRNGNPKGIGNFIRKTSLDEFPQFFNVLKGEMSLVGTRPPTVDEWEKYSPQHRKRLSIKPGITGLWQISGRSQITEFDEVVKLDSEYIDTWTVSMDIRIILKTIGKVMMKEGAE